MLSDEQITRLTKLEHQGRLTPDEVVADARKETSPLHSLFQWDDAVAAEAWRVQQARQVIHQVLCVITTTTTTVTVEQYVPDPSRGNGQGYRNISKLKGDEKRLAVVAELNRALGFMRRAEDIASALGYAGVINNLVEELVSFRDALDTPEPISTAAD